MPYVTTGTGITAARLRFFCLGLLSVLVLPCAAAQDDLGEIVVTARQPVVSSVATMHKVDVTEIDLRGDINLGDVMTLIPGVNVRVGAQGVPRIDIRGLRTRHIKLMINGVLFNSTFDGQFDPNQFPVDLMQQVKVTTGGVSELYGSGAMAVINVITPHTSDSPLTITGDMGDGGDRRFGFSSGGSHGDVDYYLSASTRQRDGFPLSSDFKPTSIEDGGLRENSDRKVHNLFTNIVWKPSANLSTGFTAMAFSGDYGLPSRRPRPRMPRAAWIFSTAPTGSTSRRRARKVFAFSSAHRSSSSPTAGHRNRCGSRTRFAGISSSRRKGRSRRLGPGSLRS